MCIIVADVRRSRVIDTLTKINNIYAYYYLGEGSVLSAERLVFSLLDQLCDLSVSPIVNPSPEASDRFHTHSSDVGESMEMLDIEEAASDLTDPAKAQTRLGQSHESKATTFSADTIRIPLRIETVQTTSYGLPDLEGTSRSRLTVSSRAETELEQLDPAQSVTHVQNSDTYRATSNLPLQKLLTALGEVCSSVTQTVFIVLDAWDEANMETVSDFYAILSKLHSINCKVFLTSRGKPGENFPFRYIPLNIGGSGNLNDVQKDVQRSIWDIVDNFFAQINFAACATL